MGRMEKSRDLRDLRTCQKLRGVRWKATIDEDSKGHCGEIKDKGAT